MRYRVQTYSEDADFGSECWAPMPECDDGPEPQVVIEDCWVCPWCCHLNPMRERWCEECGNPNPDREW